MTNVATRFQPDISGSAVPSGFVGETITANLTAGGTTSVANTFVDGTGTLALTPGTWFITVINYVRMDLNVSGVGFAATTALRTTGNTTITQSTSLLGPVGSSTATVGTTHTFTTVVNISANTSYKISVACDSNAANGSATFYANGTSYSSNVLTIGKMIAVRLV